MLLRILWRKIEVKGEEGRGQSLKGGDPKAEREVLGL